MAGKTGRKKLDQHHSAEDWVDFVMHQASQDQMSAMQEHLDSGCRKCTYLVGLWGRVGELASREASLQPPASAVQHVRRAFSILAKPQAAKRGWLIPRLAFDSQWQPGLAGTRSNNGGTHHVLYRAGDVSIDFRVEPEPRSEHVNLAGQVTLASVQEQDLSSIVVVVSSKQRSITTTTTNRFGEFHLSFVPEQGLQITFTLPGEKVIVIPLESGAVRRS